MCKLELKYNELCSGKFELLSDDQKEFLNSLNLKTYDGYKIILHNSLTKYNEKADIYFILGLRLEDSGYQEKHRIWVKERFGFRTTECILLIEGKPVYCYFERNMFPEGTSAELKGIISNCFSDRDELLLRKIIAKCAYNYFAMGWEYHYSDDRALLHLSASK